MAERERENEGVEKLSLEKQMSNIQQESRMVLPGVQALFGFQLIAVFSDKFDKLDQFDKNIHAGATGFTLLSVALILSVAALHRIAEPDRVSERLVKVSTKLLTVGLLPLLIALSLDFYLFTRVVLKQPAASFWLGAVLFVVLVGTWFVWPSIEARKRA
jgi:hypothetical protein